MYINYIEFLIIAADKDEILSKSNLIRAFKILDIVLITRFSLKKAHFHFDRMIKVGSRGTN